LFNLPLQAKNDSKKYENININNMTRTLNSNGNTSDDVNNNNNYIDHIKKNKK